MRSLAFVSVVLFVVIVGASASAIAQEGEVGAASSESSRPERARRILLLREELEHIDTDGPDFAAEIGVQLVFYGCIAATVGSLIEIISQEISTGHWRFTEPPWFVLVGAAMGGAMNLIGAPLVVFGMTDGGHARRTQLREEIERLEAELASITFSPSVSPDGFRLSMAFRF
jgi:hypothetical protein